MENIILNNGIEMPLITIGTWPLNGWRLALIVRKAVKLGYWNFDTVSAYRNEKWLEYGIKFSGKNQKRSNGIQIKLPKSKILLKIE